MVKICPFKSALIRDAAINILMFEAYLIDR